MDEKRVIKILEQAEVLLTGHFLLTSGKHSDRYLQCAKIFKNFKYSEELCALLVEKFKDDQIDIVIGPAVGAVQMAYEVSKQLGVENIFAERENGEMTLKRGFQIIKGKKYLIVEDVITTGGSVKEVQKIVENSGGIVVAIGSIVDRTNGKSDFCVKYKSVISVDVEAFEPSDCPICKEGKINLVKPGSRTII